MDLKRLQIKKRIEKIIERRCEVKTQYKGPMMVDKIVAVVSIPSQGFEEYAQSYPKIYKTDMDIRINVIGYRSNEIEAEAQEINKEVLKAFDSLDLRSINVIDNFEGERIMRGLQLIYSHETYVEQEG